jgi:hypothetical protein
VFPPIIRNSQDRDADQSTPTEIWMPAHGRVERREALRQMVGGFFAAGHV